MRKYRSWLMGLGIGLIIGASMLQLILVAQDKVNMAPQLPLTIEQLNDEAKKAELLLLSEAELNARIEEAVAAQKAAKDQEVENDQTNDSETSIKPSQASEEASATPSNDSESNQPNSIATEDDNKVTLHVSYGMTLTEVANGLKELGVIEDTEDFIKEAWDISKKMKVGNAVFVGKPTYQEIMNELTRKK